MMSTVSYPPNAQNNIFGYIFEMKPKEFKML